MVLLPLGLANGVGACFSSGLTSSFSHQLPSQFAAWLGPAGSCLPPASSNNRLLRGKAEQWGEKGNQLCSVTNSFWFPDTSATPSSNSHYTGVAWLSPTMEARQPLLIATARRCGHSIQRLQWEGGLPGGAESLPGYKTSPVNPSPNRGHYYCVGKENGQNLRFNIIAHQWPRQPWSDGR